jgi:hypothetical protein
MNREDQSHATKSSGLPMFQTLKSLLPKRSDNSADNVALGRKVAAAIAKWLVPSVSALFVLIGYAVVSAHQDFLGIQSDITGASIYISAASSFLRDLLTILPDSLLGILTLANFPKLDWAQLSFVLSLSVTCIALTLTGRRSATIDLGWAPAFLLFIFIFLKFILLDAPLANVDNVLVSSGTGSGEATNAIPIESELATSIEQKGVEGFISQRALNLWSDIVCSRVSAAILQRKAQPRITCRYEQDESKVKVQSEFIAHSIAAILLLILSAQVLRRAHTTGVAVFALLTMGYVLTWPYAYGKLIKSTYYEYGAALLGPALTDAATPLASEERTKYGMVIFHDSNSAKLLIVKKGKGVCTRGASNQEVKLWKIQNSQVLAIREIYREDVITWKLLQEQPCPQPEGPY